MLSYYYLLLLKLTFPFTTQCHIPPAVVIIIVRTRGPDVPKAHFPLQRGCNLTWFHASSLIPGQESSWMDVRLPRCKGPHLCFSIPLLQSTTIKHLHSHLLPQQSQRRCSENSVLCASFLLGLDSLDVTAE